MSFPILDRNHFPSKAPVSADAETEVILVGHGSRDAHANAEFEQLADNFRALHANRKTRYAYVEIATPSLTDVLLEKRPPNRRVVVAPLFLFGAGHLKNDIPLALASARSRHPGVEFIATRELGVHPSLIDIAWERASSLIPPQKTNDKTAVIFVGRGASDPDANGDFCKLVRLFGEGRNFSWVVPSFIGITRPLFEETAELVARSRPDRILVVPYFLFAGRLYEKLQAQVAIFSGRYPWIKTELAPCLGPERRILDLVSERIEEALQGQHALPCDTCQYRAPISGIAENVGGLRSLLWSLRHSYTHTQAVPHVHAHKAMAKHVLICGNVDCAERGSISLISHVRRLLIASGREREVRVTRTGCMGRCGEGPTVAVYPDGIWYRNMQTIDAEEFVHEHLIHDRLISRLVDNIMP
jgi:sirohydrochlorin cobaltochelatase